MKKINFNKIILLLLIHIIVCFLFSACNYSGFLYDNGTNGSEDNIGINSYIRIKNDNYIVTDCMPEFSIFTEKEGVAFMSFSGNGEEWSGWVNYSETYDKFNIASGFFGTKMESGIKKIYVRFKDVQENIFTEYLKEPIYCSFEYEMPELFSIKIKPKEVTLGPGESQAFTLKGYDLFSKNEVPLDVKKIHWSKSCNVGNLTSEIGLQTTYTAPDIEGVRNVTANYGSLSTGARIYVFSEQ